MSAHDDTQNTYRIPDEGFWSGVWRVPAILAVVGLALIGAGYDPERFGYSYLFATFTALTLVLGATFLVLIQHFTAGHWGVTSRRIAEVIMVTMPVVFVLFLPILIGSATGHFHMYDEWMHAGHHAEAGEAEGEHSEAHGAALVGAATAHAQEPTTDVGGVGGEEPPRTPQEIAHHHATLAKKTGYLSTPGWIGRALVYFVIWCLIALGYFGLSVQQDRTKDMELTNKMKGFSAAALVAFAMTLTFAAFDWIMSLMPTWYSTIYAVVIFGGSATAVLALIILIGISLFERGLVGNAINHEHFHDLAKLMFGFMCFWTYVSFSQWMLIWYANIPEEIDYYQLRYHGGWIYVAYLLVIGGFAVPFLAIMSRVWKRRLWWLRIWSAWLLGMHVVDIFWHVLPHAPGAGTLRVTLTDIGSLLFVGGIFFTFIFLMMRRQALIPVGDPRLSRGLHHHQSH